MELKNISPDWTGSTRQERRIIKRILDREATPAAVTYFAKNCSGLGDYWYWFILSTIWVSYSGWSELTLWKRLFSSTRENRESSIMKPDELKWFYVLSDRITAYRAHRENETDWISYTINPQTAAKFAVQRGVKQVTEYTISKPDIIAFFSRRGEYELIMLDKEKAVMVGDIEVVKQKS